VDTYKQRINEKLGLRHRADYVRLALKLGLLEDAAKVDEVRKPGAG
jgi:ATP/maltotriose-dependent transcriptional regulator MalT